MGSLANVKEIEENSLNERDVKENAMCNSHFSFMSTAFSSLGTDMSTKLFLALFDLILLL